jgi:hypothetical protein
MYVCVCVCVCVIALTHDLFARVCESESVLSDLHEGEYGDRGGVFGPQLHSLNSVAMLFQSEGYGVTQ